MGRLAVIALALVACGKSKQSEKAAVSSGKPIDAAVRRLAVDPLGIEVDAPFCADITVVDPDNASVTPKDPSCAVPFPGAVFGKPAPDIEPKSLDEEVKKALGDARQLEITRKEPLGSGWAIAWKSAEGERGVKAHLQVGATVVTCQWNGRTGDAEVIWKICTSAHARP